MAEAATANVEVPDDTIVTIDLPDDGTEGVVAATPPAAPATPTAADEAAARLQAAADAEKRRREAAEATAESERRRADNAERNAQQSRQTADEALAAAGNSELQLATQGIDNATKALAAAKAEFKRAFDAGEADKMADAQEQISAATGDIKDYTRQKMALESGATTRKPAHEGRVEAPTLSATEQYIQNGNFSPTAQTWLRAHPECLPPAFGGSAEKNAAMMEGHYAALRQNVQANTPKYFEIIEEHAGYREPTSAAAVTTPAGEPPAPKPAVKVKAPPVAAPPSNEPPAGPGAPPTGRRSVQLTPQQQEIALLSAPPQKPTETEAAFRKRAFGEYALNLIEATKEGKIGRVTH